MKRGEILRDLMSLVNKAEMLKDKIHEVFEPSLDWKECLSDQFVNKSLIIFMAIPDAAKQKR